MQDTSKINNSAKRYLHANNKTRQEIDYFIAGPGMEANEAARAETTLKIHDKLMMYLPELGVSKALFPYRLRMTQSHTHSH